MHRKQHILFILEYFAPHIGGVETLFSKLIDGIIAEWHKVSVVTSRYDQTLQAQEHYTENCTIYRVWHGRFDFMWYGFWKAQSLCRKQHVDLIHATTFMAAIPAGVLRKTTWLPTVLHVHEIYGQLRPRFLGKMGHISIMLEHIIFTWLRFDRYLCVSNYTKNNLRIVYGINDKKLMTVYNAIDYDAWKPLDDTGTLRKEYNIENRKGEFF